MTITADSLFHSSPRITKAKFVDVLASWRSPFADNASLYYDMFVDAGDDPSVWLAICGREHSFGTNRDSVLWRNDTKSWTNARSVRLPALRDSGEYEIITDPVRGSNYVKYRRVTDSILDGMYRIRDPEYVYVKRFGLKPTIRQVISLFTESGGAEYTEYVVAKMNEWTSAEVPEKRLTEMFSHVPTIDTTQVLTAAKIKTLPNFPHRQMDTVNYVTIHETANTKAGANAQMHRNFVANGGGKENVSFHYAVDSEAIIQIVPDREMCWHAGDGANGTGNSQSIAIEICVNSDGDYFKALYNAAYLAAKLSLDHSLLRDEVVQHNRWSGKNCPLQMRQRSLWDWFLQAVEDWRNRIITPPKPRERKFETGYTLAHGFLEFYEKVEQSGLAWATIGVPIGAELPKTPIRLAQGGPVVEVTVQPTDRGWLLWDGKNVTMATEYQTFHIETELGMRPNLTKAATHAATALQEIEALIKSL